MSGQSLVGRIGTVCVAVRGGELPGEVRVVVDGLPHYYVAYCTQALPRDHEVLVICNRGGRQIDVEPWSQPGSGVSGGTDLDGRH
jgi:membrane protein implicated in regulation of membrane protease activity